MAALEDEILGLDMGDELLGLREVKLDDEALGARISECIVKSRAGLAQAAESDDERRDAGPDPDAAAMGCPEAAPEVDGCCTRPMHWGELTEHGKLERMRQVVKELDARMSRMEGMFRSRVARHVHNPLTGAAMMALDDMSLGSLYDFQDLLDVEGRTYF